MINNVIFDIGGVILDWDLEYMLDMCKNEEEKEFVKENIFYTPEWANGGLLDTGSITQYDFIANVQERTNHVNDKFVSDFILGYYKTFHVKEEVLSLIDKLREKGIKVYILSNINDYICDKIDANKFLDKVDGYVLSYQVHEIKPNKKIYEILIDKYKLDPSKSLFIDDVMDNIKSANELGIKGRQVIKNSYVDILNILSEYKVLGE